MDASPGSLVAAMAAMAAPTMMVETRCFVRLLAVTGVVSDTSSCSCWPSDPWSCVRTWTELHVDTESGVNCGVVSTLPVKEMVSGSGSAGVVLGLRSEGPLSRLLAPGYLSSGARFCREQRGPP